MMTTAITRNRAWLPILSVFLLTTLTSTKVFAGDLGKILGALAVGYVAYEVLDDLDDSPRHRGHGPRYSPPRPHPRARVVHRRYDPPTPYFHGGEAKYWYNEGYSDGFKDGDQHGYKVGFTDGHRVGYRQGDKNGFRRGAKRGYRVGYDDGYGDGHHDGFRQGKHSRRR